MGLFAFIMDPLEKVQVDTDTTFAFMMAAQARGHRVVTVNPDGVSLRGKQVLLYGREVQVQPVASKHFSIIESADGAAYQAFDAESCQAIFIRTEPPFDEAYLNTTWLLSLVEERGRVRFVNSPKGLREANEHLYSLYWPELCPETYVGANPSDIRAFVREVGGHAIAKPIDGHGGFGVIKLSDDDGNVGALIDLLSAEGKQTIMVQRYLPEAREGDRRLLIVNGELRGVVQRVPKAGEHRANLHVGGEAVKAEVTPVDLAIAEQMRPRMMQDGLVFVGADVIGDTLIEVNVTSPTLIQELHRLGGPDLADEVIQWAEG